MVPFRLLVRFKIFQLVGVAALAVPINTFLSEVRFPLVPAQHNRPYVVYITLHLEFVVIVLPHCNLTISFSTEFREIAGRANCVHYSLHVVRELDTA